MRLKRGLSILLSIMMLIGILPMTAFADGLLVGDEKGKVSLVYMQYKSGYTSDTDGRRATEPIVEETAVPSSIPVDTEFMVGIKLTDFTNIVAAEQAINIFALGLTYNSKYVEPVDTNVSSLLQANQRRMGDAWEDKEPPTPNDPILNNSSGYAFTTSSMNTGLAVNGDIKAYTVVIENNTNPSYTGAAENGDVLPAYAGIIKFKLISELPADGVEVFGVMTGEATNVSFDVDGAAGSFKYGIGDSRMEDIVDFDISKVNLAPFTYQLVYNIGDGSWKGTAPTAPTVQQDQKLDTGVTLAGKADITPPEGKIFGGWYIDLDGTAGYDSTTDVLVNGDTVYVSDYANESNEITLNAYYSDGYNVTIHPNGGAFGDSTDPIVTDQVKDAALDTTYFPTSDPIRENYEFKGWNTAANGTGTAVADITAYNYNNTSTTVYAQWEVASDVAEEDKVTVIFDSNGATTAAVPASITLVKNDTIGLAMPNNPVKTNYKFMGWNTKQNGAGEVFDGTTEVNANLTVYAQWEGDETIDSPANVRVDFTVVETEAGITQPNPEYKILKAGETIGDANMPDVPTRNNYVFDKWVDVANEASEFTGTTTVDADIEVKALWDSAVNISFYANDGSGDDTPAAVVPAAMNKAIPTDKIPKLTRDDGYVLVGWNTDPNGIGTDLDASYTVTGAASFYAVWQAVKDTDGDGVPDEPIEADTDAIQVNFNVNCADENAVAKPATRYLKNGHTSLSQIPTTGMPTATREKYTLKGWYATPGGTGDEVLHTTDLTPFVQTVDTKKVVNLYAQWEVDDTQLAEDDVKVIVRTFQRRGMTEALEPTYTVVAGEALGFELDVPARGGFTHEGWVDSDDAEFLPLTTTIPAGTAAEDGNYYFDVYATWGATLTVTLSDLTKTFNEEQQGATVVSFVGDNSTTIASEDFVEGVDYLISYSVLGGEPVADEEGNPIRPTNAGTYEIDFVLLSDGSEDDGVTGIIINDMQPDNEFTIQKAAATFALAEGASQSVKISATSKTLALTATAPLNKTTGEETKTLVQGTHFKVQYASLNEDGSWTDLPGWGDNEPVAIGDYAAKIVMLDDNYQVGGLDQSIQYYGEAGSDVSERIKFKVTPDIELNGFAIVGSDEENFEAPKDLYDEQFANVITFDKDTNSYYVTAGVGEDIKIQFDGTFGADTEITITRNEEAPETITTTVVDDKPTTGEITLAPANGTNNGISNTITVNLSGTDDGPIYTIYVRQLVEAKITLSYGNSPYGEIMKSDIEDKDEAKTQFNLNNRFVAEYTPENVAPKAKTSSFGYRSWVDVAQGATPTEDEQALIADSNVNMDRNDYAIFIYDNTESFVDPGFTVTNSIGETVPVTRTLSVGSMASKNTNTFASGVVTDVDITIPDGTEAITQITNLETGFVVPGIYDMTYSAQDIDGSQIMAKNGAGESVPVQRKVVVLHRLGDTDFSGAMGAQDFNQLYAAVKNVRTYLPNVDATTRRLYIYRGMDTDFSDGIGAQDFNAVYAAVKSSAKHVESLYNELPTGTTPEAPVE